jgi:hypothetical protein
MAIQLRLEQQQNRVSDEVSAITAVVRPILSGVLYALKKDVVESIGGYERVQLKLLPRLYRPGDGDCGICFEYAVHDAMNRGEDSVRERVVDALRECNVRGVQSASILFGAEKAGSVRLIDTASELLTDDSRLLAGNRGQPVKLRNHIAMVAAAFRRREFRELLPWSISGLWKADLFVGVRDKDRWVGTSVKINRDHLEPARGLRIGIVPTRQGSSDSIVKDDARNLVICPIPHDQAFMEVFYQGWQVVQAFMAADAQVPKEVALPRAPERQVASYLATRREFPVVDVIEALRPLSQPELLHTKERPAAVVDQRDAGSDTNTLEAPIPRRI